MHTSMRPNLSGGSISAWAEEPRRASVVVCSCTVDLRGGFAVEGFDHRRDRDDRGPVRGGARLRPLPV